MRRSYSSCVITTGVSRQVPPPTGDADAPARAMIFDSVYDIYRGVVTYVRVVDGKITPREKIAMMSTGATHELLEVGTIAHGQRDRQLQSARWVRVRDARCRMVDDILRNQRSHQR